MLNMHTITIQTNHEAALRLIEELATLDLLKVISKGKEPVRKVPLSERLAGSLTKKQAAIAEEELQNMRSEWERNI
ncbi:MAG: hypothetical protein AB8F95_10635 [Bacteroidia bacterium]